MIRVLCVINSYKFGIDNVVLCDVVDGWVSQKLPENVFVDIVVSDVLSDTSNRNFLFCYLKSKSRLNKQVCFYVSLYDVGDRDSLGSVYISFNSSIKIMHSINKYKHYDYYIYNAEDCVLSNSDDFTKILKEFENNDICLVSALVDNDNSQLYTHYNEISISTEKTIVSIGESINMHFFVFNKYFMNNYNFKYPDVLTAFATESMLTFFCAAINKLWVHCRKVCLLHKRNHFSHKGLNGWLIFRNFKTFDELFKNGYDVGFGFECHDDKFYDFNKDLYEGNKCKCSNKLYEYIKRNMYLPKEIFNYDEFIANARFATI